MFPHPRRLRHPFHHTGLTLALTLAVVAVLLLATHGRAQLGIPRTVDVIRSYGYSAEERSVKTEDGYILAYTHIKSSGTKLPVLMVHGVTGASDSWVLQGPHKDLALLLVDAGHDVWLGDVRGNHYSTHHITLKTSDPRFWNFSFHEIGMYDIPAFVDLVLANSGSQQLQYIGHSMGTTVFLVMCSLRPQYNNKIQNAVLLSPVAFKVTKNVSQFIHLLIPQAKGLAKGLMSRGVYKLLGRTRGNLQLVENTCNPQSRQLCLFMISQAFGAETQITDILKLRIYLKALISAASIKTLLHLSQIVSTNTFAQFDYGRSVNYVVYNSKTPPSYPLEKITCPVALIYSDQDTVVDDNSVAKLKRALPNVTTTVSIPHYNHIDVIFADSAASLLYNKIIILLN